MISYHDYREDFYHAFFAGIFAGAGYVVEFNKKHGEGGSNIVVKDYSGDCVAVFDVKYLKAFMSMDGDCERGLAWGSGQKGERWKKVLARDFGRHW